MTKQRRKISGQRFSELTAKSISHYGETKLGRVPYWRCRCACGRDYVVRQDALVGGITTRCRSCSRKNQAKKLIRHGHAKKRNLSKTYRSWSSMIQRCYNEKCLHYRNYGGRGITVCKEWLDFAAFLRDMGNRNGLTLERIDVNGPYCKANCRWATRKKQQNNRRSNRRLKIGDEEKTAAQWSEYYGIAWNTVRGRLARGWELESAFVIPVDKRIWANRRIKASQMRLF